MHAFLLSAILAATPAPATAAPATTSPSVTPVEPATATATTPAPVPALRDASLVPLAPRTSAATASSSSGVVFPAIVLAGMAAAGIFFFRKRTKSARFVQVLETASLGPRRSLVVARLGKQVLLLGASEAGIHLLSTQPADAEIATATDAVVDAAIEPLPAPIPPIEEAATGQGAGLGILGRLRRRPAPQPFDALLTESVEDQELRRKLAHGLTGSVR